MGYAYIIEEQGGCEALKKIKTKDKPLEPGQVRLKQEYLGLNFQDILLRRGDKKVQSAFVPGFEACGIITEISRDVEGFSIGDRVAYATAPIGACVDHRNIHAKYLIKIPDYIKMDEVCGFFLKGLWAHTLMERVYKVAKGNFILVHSAAGGVGTILTQMLRNIGAEVIGTAGSNAKLEFAEQNGCIKAMKYHDPNFFREICYITDNLGVNVAYDPIGKATFEVSMLALSAFGLYVPYGSVSGAIKKINTDMLAKKSLFLSAPSFNQYKSSRKELEIAADRIFTLRKNNIIKNNITKILHFDELREAHHLLEERKIVGSLVIKL